MEHANDNVPTPDDIIREHGLDKVPPGAPPPAEPELNPDHGKDRGELPEEHQIPLDEARKGLDKKKAA